MLIAAVKKVNHMLTCY